MSSLKKGFTIVELMIAITVFSIGALGVFALVTSSIRSSNLAQQESIAANISREQIELVHWLRDSNWMNDAFWTKTPDHQTTPNSISSFGSGFWLMENDFQKGGVKILALPADFSGAIDTAYSPLFLTESGTYFHSGSLNPALPGAQTPWKSYIQTEQISADEIRVSSVVRFEGSSPREWIVRTLLTNWKK